MNTITRRLIPILPALLLLSVTTLTTSKQLGSSAVNDGEKTGARDLAPNTVCTCQFHNIMAENTVNVPCDAKTTEPGEETVPEESCINSCSDTAEFQTPNGQKFNVTFVYNKQCSGQQDDSQCSVTVSMANGGMGPMTIDGTCSTYPDSELRYCHFEGMTPFGTKYEYEVCGCNSLYNS